MLIYARELLSTSTRCAETGREMASKAYVASMTVTELKQELKQRGLSTRGSKKSLRDRLERAFDEEELNDSSSESESGGKLGPSETGFNFSVPAESFLPPDQIREDSPVMSPDRDKMIISVELSNKETLEVYSPNPPSASREDEGGGGGGGGGGGPLVVAVSVPNDERVIVDRGPENNHNSIPTVTVAVAQEDAEPSRGENEAPPVIMTNCTESNGATETQPPVIEPSSTNVASTDEEQVLERLPPQTASEAEEAKVGVEESEGGEERAGVVVGGEGEGVDGSSGEKNEMVVGVDAQVEGEGKEGARSESGLPSVEEKEEVAGEAETMDADLREPLQSSASGEANTAVEVEAERGEEEREGEEEERGGQSIEQVEKEKAGDEPSVGQDEPGETLTPEEDEWVIIEHVPPSTEESRGEAGKAAEGVHSEPVEERESTETVQEVSSKGVQEEEEEETGAWSAEEGRKKEEVEESVEDMDIEEKEEEATKEEVRKVDDVGDVPMEQEEGSELPAAGEENVQKSPESPAADVSRAPDDEQHPQPVISETSDTTPEVSDKVPSTTTVTESESTTEGRLSPPEQPVDPSETTTHQQELVEPTEQEEVEEEEEEVRLTEEIPKEEEMVESAATTQQDDQVGPTESTQQQDISEEVTATPPLSPGAPPAKPVNDTQTSPTGQTVTAAASVEEVSEGVNMEVAVLVHAEEDDLSVFSTEAAEAQKIASSAREKERGSGASSAKARDRAREKDRDKSSSSTKHRRSSSSSAASLLHPPSSSSSSSSAKQAGLVEEGAGSNASGRSGSEAAKADTAAASRSSPTEETKHCEGDKAENQAEPPSKKRRRISAHTSSSSSSGAEPASIQWGGGGGGERRRRWGSGKQRSGSSTTNISSDILKDIIPSELEVGEGEGGSVGGEGEEGEELSMEGTEVAGGPEKSIGKDQMDEHQLEWEEKLRQKEAKQREAERARQELETRQRIEARVRARLEQSEARDKDLEKEPGKQRSPSPAQKPPSHILHVRNLTRPFTQTQLRQLLASDGPLLKDGFWTNNVKSHCIAVYGSKDVATTTRHRLHGLKWPSTNPKLLSVDFLSPEEVQKISEGDLVVMTAPPEVGEGGGEEGEGGGEGGGEKGGEKGDGDGGEAREGVKGEGETEEKLVKIRRESSGMEKAEQKKDGEKENQSNNAVEESAAGRSDLGDPGATPAPQLQEKPPSQATKLLDDLFRKTKATPSIYWLPLTEAEVQVKQQEREAREAEREKRRLERQRAYEEERKKEREREKEREEMAKKERERRIQEERERRARERVRRRSRSRDHSHSRSRSRSRDRYRDRDRRRR